MPITNINVRFDPEKLKANARNEAMLVLGIENTDSSKNYWCESEVSVKPPLSLAHDIELNMGKTRVGILKPLGKLEKKIKIYTRPNNFPDTYTVNITTYVYDEEGVIAERIESKASIPCV
ncbi:MAG: hypothetical protein QW194_00330 [Candidatus Micrarchaeaceae archaeon]|jgi:hypothetical protein